MATRTQRDMMRELHGRYRGNAERIIRAYAEAEERGEVERRSDRHGLTPDQYARALWADAERKGWITETQKRR